MSKIWSLMLLWLFLSIVIGANVEDFLKCLVNQCQNQDLNLIDVSENRSLSFGDLVSLLPTVNQGDTRSSSIPITQILSTLIINQTINGVLVLESGDGELIEWSSTSPNQTLDFTSEQGNYVSDFARESPDPVSNLPIYLIQPNLYSGNFEKLIYLPNSESLFFNLIQSDQPLSMDICSSSSLVFALINFDDQLEDWENIHLGNSKFSISNHFIRLCPIVMESSTEVKVLGMSPEILKIGINEKIELSMEVNEGSHLSVSSCILISEEKNITMRVFSMNNYNLTIIPSSPLIQGDFSLHCDIQVDGDPLTIVAPKRVSVFEDGLSSTTSKEFDLNPTTQHLTTQSINIDLTTSSGPIAEMKFTDDLTGLSVISMTGDYFPMGYLNCSNVFMDPMRLGVNASCMGTGMSMLVSFGSGATLMPYQSLTLRTSSYTNQLFAAMPTLNVLPPDNPISPSFLVINPSKVSSCTPITSISLRQLSGQGNRNPSFQWTVSHNSPVIRSLAAQNNGRNFSLPTSQLGPGNLSIGVTVCNYLSKCTTVSNISILVDDKADGVFGVSISGGGRVYPSMRILLEASPSFIHCGSPTSTSPSDTHYEWYENGNLSSQAGSYKISPYTHSIGDSIQYQVQSTYSSNGTLYSSNASIILNFISEPLLVVLNSYQLTVPSDQSINIDASQSKDPNTPMGILSHSWSCLNKTSNTSCSLDNVVRWDHPQLFVPPAYLNENMSFVFTDVVNGSGLNASISSIVSIIKPKTPQIRFIPFSQGKVNIQDYIRIQSFVASSFGPLNTSWQVVNRENYGFFDLDLILPQNWKSFSEDSTQSAAEVLVSLTIPPASDNWPGLQSGTTYAVELIGSNNAGRAMGLFEFITNAPPIAGDLDISPSGRILALNDPVIISMGDGWIDEDSPFMFRFGIKTLNLDNSSTVIWNRQSMTSSYHVYLATAGPPPKTGCGKRIGYTALIEVCDRLSACTIKESPKFVVSPPSNVSISAVNLLNAISSDMANELIFSALNKLDAVMNEQCNLTLSPQISNQLAEELLESLDDSSTNDEYREVLNAVTQMLGSVDGNVLRQMSKVMAEYQKLISSSSSQNLMVSLRKKRDTISAATLTSLSSDDGVFVLTDRLLGSGELINDLYMKAIEDWLHKQCTQVGDTSERIISTKGEGYTYVQVQSLSTSDPSMINRSYPLAGPSIDRLISFDEIFQSNYASWYCNGGATLTDFVCLASADISSALFKLNPDFSSYFFDNQYALLSMNKSASNLYRVSIKDQILGTDVIMVGSFKIIIPISSYKASNYYNCFIFSSNAWSSRGCLSSSFASIINGTTYLQCICTQTGIIGVFIVPPPIPFTVPSHNQIQITFHFIPNTTILSSSSEMNFLSHLSSSTSIDRSRFIESNVSIGSLSFILTPPSTPNQISNSYAIQAILRAIDPNSGQKLTDTGVKLGNFTWRTIVRNLTGDGLARKVISRIDHSYSTVVGNSTSLASQWASAIAESLRISEYRIKNPQIFPGIIFNFTITVPYDQEIDPLSAEEISQMLIEFTGYGVLELISSSKDILLMNPLTEADIVILMVLESSNALAIGIVSGISLAVGLATIYVLGAVYVKLRMDKLIQMERERVLMSNPVPPPPQYPLDVQEPPLITSDNLQRRRNRSTTTHR